MVGAAKSMGHNGLIVYGTPGIVVLHHRPGEDDEREFLAASRKIGKKVRNERFGCVPLHLIQYVILEARLVLSWCIDVFCAHIVM